MLYQALKLSFNSTLVQLKAGAFFQYGRQSKSFQFYLSSIKRWNRQSTLQMDRLFQFYLSSIKSR